MKGWLSRKLNRQTTTAFTHARTNSTHQLEILCGYCIQCICIRATVKFLATYLPAFLPACLPAPTHPPISFLPSRLPFPIFPFFHFPTFPPSHVPTFPPSRLPAFPPSHLPAFLPALPACYPPTYLHSSTPSSGWCRGLVQVPRDNRYFLHDDRQASLQRIFVRIKGSESPGWTSMVRLAEVQNRVL